MMEVAVKNMLSRLLLAPVLLVVPAIAMAAPHASSGDAQRLLDHAVAEMGKVGPARAFAEFTDPKGGFTDRDLYVFVFSTKGTYEATGAGAQLVGTGAIDMTDAEGKPLVQAMIAALRDQPQGKVDYVWLNRADNRVEHKVSWVRRVGDHIVGVGYYKG